VKPKILKFDKEARTEMSTGVEELAKAVASTMGPSGRVVVNLEQNIKPVATKDGVSVAREINFKDPFKNIGAQLVKQAAQHTGDEAGDGTTTATVLAAKLLREANKAVDAGANPVFIKKGLDLASKDLVKALKKVSKPCKTNKEIKQVATISCNGDTNIGKLISKAMGKIGKDGTITIEESATLEDDLELVDGVRFKKGLVSPYFLPMHARSVTLENAYVLVTSKSISNIRDMVGMLEDIAKQGRSLLVIADNVEREALQALVLNNAKGLLTVAAVQPPDMGEFRNAALDDLALLTGTRVITEDMGEELESLTSKALGS
jgi:chaperonin GroEL